jgi:hypothetical protein
MENLPDKYKTGIDHTTRFSYTAYNFPSLVEVCEKLARDAVARAGGRIEKDEEGAEAFVIPLQKPVPGPLEQCWEPAAIENDVYFTEEEMDQIIAEAIKSEQ